MYRMFNLDKSELKNAETMELSYSCSADEFCSCEVKTRVEIRVTVFFDHTLYLLIQRN